MSRTTAGTTTTRVALCIAPSPPSTRTAFSVRTSTTARRDDTTHKGSYVALSTSASATAHPPRPAWHQASVSADRGNETRLGRDAHPRSSDESPARGRRGRQNVAVTSPVQLSMPLRNFAAEDPRDWSALVELAVAADTAGVDRLVVSDHVVMGEALADYGDPAKGG